VRTDQGLFTAYTVAGKGYKHRQWRLMWRREGKWQMVADGVSGKDPVNLLASPDGTLHVIGWPEGKGTIWSGKPSGGKVKMRPAKVPGVSEGHWPYSSAGIDKQGNLCILSSEGEKPGAMRWAFRRAKTGKWTTRTTKLRYRHCYTYVFPDGGGLSLVSTRDVQWRTLGYEQPKGAFSYAFNAFRYWRTSDVGKSPLKELAFVEERPSKTYPYAFCNAQNDAYVDTAGRMHILYRRTGPSTRGKERRRHAVVSADGNQLHDAAIPPKAGTHCRIFQDDRKRFYLLGSAGVIYPAGDDGLSLGKAVKLDLGTHAVEYSGFGLAVPRTGTPPANFIDAVFPSGKGKKWIYCRILLYGDAADKTKPATGRH
jgi:hypothetical protein